MKIYVINGKEFKVNVLIKKTNKNTYFRYKNGIINITSPKSLSDEYVISTIKKYYNRLIKMESNISKSNTIHYLGNEYPIIVYDSTRNYLEIKNDIAYIYTSKLDDKHIYKIVYSYYFEAIKDIIECHHLEYEDKFNVSNIRYSIKDVKTYFGQCNPKKKIISLSAKLAKYKKELILSVLAHELAHFKYQNHQSSFYNYLESIIPGYRKLQKELKRTKYNDKY